jgi:hypothetical protein
MVVAGGMSWSGLDDLLSKVGRFIANALESFMALARDLFLDARS